nr:MAG TPA: Cytosine specific methyltransferase [Caudoviricetes sp.]
MELTHMSLCTGIGGIDLAAEWAGFKTIAQCEIDEYASKVLAKNFKGAPNLHDIRTVTNERLAELGIDRKTITVLSAGFPCQPYSLAGKGLGDSDERDLWGEVARVIGEIRPRWFVGENTPGLFARVNQRYFKRILTDLAALGYSVGWGIWGACDVGAPHRRDRVFIVAYADGKRCHTHAIQRREFTQSRITQNARRIQESWMQSKRVGRRISDATGNELWVYGCTAEIEESRRERNNYGSGTKRNAGGEWWKIEPDVGRVAYGISHRVDRLRCLGNAVVPQQIYPVFQEIANLSEVEIHA